MMSGGIALAGIGVGEAKDEVCHPLTPGVP
jgi:hypothetical protein